MQNERNTLLQCLKIKETISKFNKWGCGCDYLRCCYKNPCSYIEEKLELLDTDNSNFCTEEIGGISFTLQKIKTSIGKGLNFSVSYNDVSVPCGQFVQFDENTRYLTNCYGKMDFYGSMFRLCDMGFFDYSLFLLLKVKISSEDPRITRFDYRVDFFSMKEKEIPSPEEFLGYIHPQSKIRKWEKGSGVYEDWDIGKTSRNNRYALRYYDKLLDSDKKMKMFLYQDYFIYKSVHRVEIEFQPNFLKGYNFYDFYEGVIQDRIESILGLNEKMFIGPMFYQYQEDYRIQDKDKSTYLKRYSSSSVRLAKNGINPLIQCYKSLFYELEENELQKNITDFLYYIGSDVNTYKVKFDYKKQYFLDLQNV